MNEMKGIYKHNSRSVNLIYIYMSYTMSIISHLLVESQLQCCLHQHFVNHAIWWIIVHMMSARCPYKLLGPVSTITVVKALYAPVDYSYAMHCTQVYMPLCYTINNDREDPIICYIQLYFQPSTFWWDIFQISFIVFDIRYSVFYIKNVI